MTTLTDTRTLTDRALAASAARVLHAAEAMDRPYTVADDLVVVWQGNRGMFTNVAYVLAEPHDWGDVLARVAAVVPTGRPASLVSAVGVPDFSALGWHLVGHPPLMVRPAGGVRAPAPADLTVAEVVDEAGLDGFERALVDAFPTRGCFPIAGATCTTVVCSVARPASSSVPSPASRWPPQPGTSQRG